MPRQPRFFLLISYAFALLVAVLMQSACKDVLSGEEFINKIKGEWYVITLNHSPVPIDPNWVEIQVYKGRIYYRNSDLEKYYYLNDSIVCTLPHMEKIQYWTITENNGDLFLETQDLCGVIRNYKMEYSNYRFHTPRGKGADIDGIDAEIFLVNQDTIITLEDFSLRKSTNPDLMSFDVVTLNSHDSFNVRRLE